MVAYIIENRTECSCLYVSNIRVSSFSSNVTHLAVKLGRKEDWLKATCLFTEPRLRLFCQPWTAQHRLTCHLCVMCRSI